MAKSCSAVKLLFFPNPLDVYKRQVQFPPSLVNIFKEIKADIGTDAPTTGNLTRWAEQGVLLLIQPKPDFILPKIGIFLGLANRIFIFILGEIEDVLDEIEERGDLLPKSELQEAITYLPNEWHAVVAIFNSGDTYLDNNMVERMNRYISLSRKNSLFFGSHKTQAMFQHILQTRKLLR